VDRAFAFPWLKSIMFEPGDRTKRQNNAQNPNQDVDMTNRVCAVKVEQLPETLSVRQGRLFLGELEDSINVDRPSIVLDCSKVRRMDRPAINLLLCCLEEAMKRNGDVKLAAVPQEARPILERSGVDHLFEIFDTNAEAVNSFSRIPADGPSNEYVSFGSHPVPENAA
jgi:anti-anti-sigma regulatory factor